MLGALASNQYGFDGPAHWTNVAAGDDPKSDLLGKNIARALVAAPIVGAVLAYLTTRAGIGRFVLPALGLAIAAFGVNLGLGNLASVLAPWGTRDTPSNVFSAGNSGAGLAAAGPSLLIFFGGLILVAPVLVPALLADSTGGLAAVGAFGAAYGTGAWWLGWRAASQISAHRQPELLESLSARASG
jgi:ABC-2 type transport system permease protein